MGSSTYGQTHEVTNQAPPLERCNAMTTDAALLAAVEREGAAWHLDTLTRDGLALTHPDILALADLANRHTPEHHPFSARGERIDAIEFHPAWHTLLSMLREQGIHSLPFETATPKPGSMAARAAGYFLHAQLESGSLCPLTMTFASIPVLQQEPALYAKLKAQLLSRHHDPRDISLDASKRSMMIGMGMTEKQGGSDVRSNRTRAFPEGAGGRGGEYRLIGHKWFFSAPQCDAHLVLARTGGNTGENGPVSCFYVPRFAPDGSKNAVQVQQLKDKLGNRSNASSEVEFLDAYGIMIGEEGRGVPTIIEMANFTRLDCVIGSAALMRAALIQAVHHARHRRVFGAKLIDQPLMRNVLADLALESEAATVLFMRLAGAFENSAKPEERAWRRIVTPAAKFWICKRALEFTGEAMEVWGGNGYVETGPMARFYREAPVNSIWEGSGNVMCLDVLRAFEREPDAARAMFDSWQAVAGEHRVLGDALKTLLAMLQGDPATREASARGIAQQLVLTAQGVLLAQHAPAGVAAAFVETRLGDARGSVNRVYGTLPATFDFNALIERAFAG
ncbi:isovaleryl-CoA dehydrogenase [Caballeronia sordidicola]|uniref:Acyl-CoA dehydrogenase n=1 Tax=Caballeronia sordidicola TaxID=196367 RepID=A0A226WYC0_CABSO|nr:isovaleryl-CoA dehydrogenase [Caballeronia sordidicola]OXC76206.1 Acyl-CoA dehydrogenase [Caballeronia sordidicola]